MYCFRLNPHHVRLILFNVWVVMPFCFLATHAVLPFRREVGSVREELTAALLLLVAEEILFYAAHRIMHSSRWLMKKVHSIHHSPVRPVGFQAFYAHPAEVLVVNLGPIILMHALRPLALLTLSVSVSLGLVNTVLSGHTSRGNHPDVVDMHQIHHIRPQCNYGFLFMDHLLGTHFSKAARSPNAVHVSPL